MLISLNWETKYVDGSSMQMEIFDVGYLPGNIWYHTSKIYKIGRFVFKVDFHPCVSKRYNSKCRIGTGLHILNIWKSLIGDTKQELIIEIKSVKVSRTSTSTEST